MGREPNNYQAENSIESDVRRSVFKKERVRLVKFLTLLGVGGTEKQVVELASRLDPERFDIAFACLHRAGELLDVLNEKGIPVDEYPIRSFFEINCLRQQWRFARQLKRDRIQVVHSYNFYANVFCVPAAKIAGVPCVIASLRDIGVYMTPNQRRVHRLACLLADHIIVNAEAIKEWLVDQGYQECKISVIRNGVAVPDSSFKSTILSSVFQEFDIEVGAPLVTMVARIDRKKGVEDLIDAGVGVLEKFYNARFLVVGPCLKSTDDGSVQDYDYKKELLTRVKQRGLLGKFHFLGHRDNVTEILSASTVSVLPSLSEGLSNTLLESMACGVPVVSTNVGGTPEIISDGIHGLLVPPSDPAALTTALCRVLSSPTLARKMKDAGKQRAAELYSFEKMTHSTEQLYLKLLADRNRRNPSQR